MTHGMRALRASCADTSESVTATHWELPCDPRRPEPPMDWRLALGVFTFVTAAFAALITIEIGAALGWWT